MPHSINRASRIALLGTMIAASCFAACTLMKPSHEDLSGGEAAIPGVDASLDVLQDASVEPDANTSPEADAEAEADVADAREDTKDGEPADADAAPDGPSDANDEPDALPLTCEAGGKVCQNDCVPVNDPDYGCGITSCTPCALSSADAGCQNGKCSISACNTGLSDCDDASANGCESNKQIDPQNCGTCGNICAAPLNMTSQCVAGECTAPVCASDWADCDQDGGVDGCETPVANDPDNCGSCGNVCADGPNGMRDCTAGKCGFDCMPNYEDCDADLLNGCETEIGSDVSNCGSCGHKCTFAHGVPGCFFGICRLDSCTALWDDCNSAEFDGCEKDVSSDKMNCGACWNKCVGGQTCVQGQCI